MREKLAAIVGSKHVDGDVEPYLTDITEFPPGTADLIFARLECTAERRRNA